LTGFLTGYKYRKQITLGGGSGSGTDYQMVFKVYFGSGTDSTETVNGETVGKIYLNGHSQTTFNDVRFTNLSNTVYTYKRTSKVDSDYAVFAVKVNEDLDSDRQIYIYYGNSGASDASSDDTFIDVITGVVGAWSMNEADSGSAVVDYSGNGNNGTPTGTSIEDGKFTGMKCRGFNDASKILTSRVDLTGQFSIVVWLYRTNSAGNDFFAGWTTTSNKLGFLSGSTTLFIRTVDSGTASDDVPDCPAASWIQVAVTRDASNKVDAYLNDGSAIRRYADAAQAGTFFFGLIGDDNSGNKWLGKIGPCLLWNGETLTASQIANLYSGFGDPSLEAGKVLVRKWATTSVPTYDGFGGEEKKPYSFGLLKRRVQLPTFEPFTIFIPCEGTPVKTVSTKLTVSGKFYEKFEQSINIVGYSYKIFEETIPIEGKKNFNLLKYLLQDE